MPLLGTLWLLAAASAAAALPDTPATDRRVFEVQAIVQLSRPATNGHLALWVPYPIDDAHQRVLRYTAESRVRWQLRQEKMHGNRMLYAAAAAHELIYPVTSVFRWRVERRAVTGPIPVTGALGPYQQPLASAPLLAPIRTMAQRVASDGLLPVQQWPVFYDYVYRSIQYDKRGEGWGQGDPLWICENKRGNCTDFHSLLIMLGQVRGLTARFNMGLPMQSSGNAGTIPGYHCWAELYDGDRGWIAVDASEAKKTEQRDAYYGRLPADRVQFSRGRHLRLDPPQHAAPLNYFIYPYAELNGNPYDAITVQWSYRLIP